ncbi:MAG: hypothetical protein ACHQX3_00750 [Nitrospirales bacterium]|jgi:hypothetical protein
MTEVERIEDEAGWPYWPLLPMKKPGTMEIGVLLGRPITSTPVPGTPFRFYPNGNIWNHQDTWGAHISITAEELVEQGWVGD